MNELNGYEIAIIGMSCRFPGAQNPQEFWKNLCAGVESLTCVTAEDLQRGGLDPQLLDDPTYVPYVPTIDNIEFFDAGFFGYTPLEAKLMDPQHRLFLECAWEAFEQAGHLPESYRGKIGVFTGAKTNTYLFNLFRNPEFFQSLDTFQIALGNDLACMSTRVAYKFDLRGPSYSLHTACSTSLIAVHLACQSLLLNECDTALAGGAAINVPQHRGYFYQKGGILSPDGSCRTFDAGAQGSNFGNGVGAVVLKRLEDAIADGDHISAVIRGSASNNDGAQKASYTAPGVEGQTDVLLEAMACAGVAPDTISYIETHGTATDLGDAIEILALTEAFREASGYRCALGSVKTNIGHLETAAGIAGLIKTALALQHRQIPPTLHFEKPNPKINFADSSFYVNTKLTDWETGPTPRRAGVSSFGIGSANAHVILEEAPPRKASGLSRPWQLLLLSARSETALDAVTANLVAHLREQPKTNLPDIAYTLATGRKKFLSRRAAVCSAQGDVDSVQTALEAAAAFTQPEGVATPPISFLFPGLGDHYPRMGWDLYQTEPIVREHIDRGAQLLQPRLGFDIRDVLYKEDSKPDLRRLLRRDQSPPDETQRRLDQTHFIQPVTFLVEYALAQLWMRWGVQPQSMMGYSIGEYVAACLAGVLSFEDALSLVAARALMIEELPAGAMLAISLSEAEVVPFLQNDLLSLAAVNGPATCVLSGTLAAVEALEYELRERQVVSRRLHTTHAFHSKMTEVLAGRLTELVKTFKLNPPQIPYISNLTGTWIAPEEATDPGYWARHMSGTVRFSEGVTDLVQGQKRVLLEVGPGQGLTAFVKQHPDCDDETARLSFATLPGAYHNRPESAFVLETLGKLWMVGQNVDWSAFYANEERRRVPLPTYPFERQRYWVDLPNTQLVTEPRRVTLDKQEDIADWLYIPAWKPLSESQLDSQTETPPRSQSRWLIFNDELGLGTSVAAQLRRDGHDVCTVIAGEEFARSGDCEFVINPHRADDYKSLLSAINESGRVENIVHLWSVSSSAAHLDVDSFQQTQALGFYSLLFLAQALGSHALSEELRLEVITHEAQRVTGREVVRPENATLVGPARVIPQEFPKVACRCIDVVMTGSEVEDVAQQLVSEFQLEHDGRLVAYREGHRWVQDFEPAQLDSEQQRLKEHGVYLITGGTGGLGLTLAEHLAQKLKARLVLTGRAALPEREEWPTWLEAHATDDPLSTKIRAVMRMEEFGAEVMTVAADVSDESQMRRAIEDATQRFGTINGVIHLAGRPGGGIIQLKTREMAEQIFDPKVKGAFVLAKLFSGRELDFLVIYSSIASILGEFGQVDYCAANAFLDALAQARTSQAVPYTAVINWDIWQEVGLAVHTEVPPHLRQWRQEMLAKGILNSEGVEVFERVLQSGLPQVIVSTQDLAGRIELGKSFTGESFLEELRKSGETQTHSSRRVLGTSYVAAGSNLEQQIAQVWQRVLGAEQVGVNDNFFDLGGNSLLGLQLVSELSRELGLAIAPVTLFEFPTVKALAHHLNPQPQEPVAVVEKKRAREDVGIAIIGMAGRFPGAQSVEQLWSNLCEGRESVSFFSDQELLDAGVPPSLINKPNYVKAGSVIEDIEQFDAELFGFSPREAEVMDPQHRLFLECAWEVLERSGYDPWSYQGSVGVFAGSNLSTYLLTLHADPKVRESVNMLQAILGNDKDSLTTMVSYKLNLRGPSIAVQTFCSTSLVAVHMACQSLRSGECSMALAGGIRIVVPSRQGYLFERGGLAPSDGHTRSFDAKADGSILANGVGIVCLKRLEDAVADGDHIHAVIKGSAVNNDGSLKAGYTAPSVARQADAILAALDDAGVAPESISYTEAHGSATELGDPIEIAALTKAFRSRTSKKTFCPIGSVKSNFGHLDRAAGVTALIKTALSLEHKQIPPSINFDESNPQIDFANSPFYVNTSLAEWNANGEPRRACVNSLGMGGTNAHVIVEEAPPAEPSDEGRPWQLLLLSAKTEAALDAATERLAAHLAQHPELNPSDVAYTLQVGRRALEFRRAVVCKGLENAGRALTGAEPGRMVTAYHAEGERNFVFMFPGLGGQYINMGRGLYESEPVFKGEVDRCCEILLPLLGFDLRKEIFPENTANDVETSAASIDLRKMLGRKPAIDSGDRINETIFTQPLLFVIEYALARLLMEWGIRPAAMVGYSLGEYVAATLAGVMSLEDALKLVAERARMIEGLASGALLAVGLSEDKVLPLLDQELCLMATNGPEQCVISGPNAAIETLRGKLDESGISYRQLPARHAFHSTMMQPIFDAVVSLAAGVELNAPQIPYLSNVTGTWIHPEEATDPTYWARHMCQPVRFLEGIQELLKDSSTVLLEIGAPSLSSIILQYPSTPGTEPPVTINFLRHSYETHSDLAYLLQGLGKLWLLGARPNWTRFYAPERRRRVLLPAYPFQRRRYWIDAQVNRRYVGEQDDSQKQWFYVPSWKRTPAATGESDALNWWVLVDKDGLGNELADALERKGRTVMRLHAGSAFARDGASSFTISPSRQEDYAALIDEAGAPPDAVVHLWDLSSNGDGQGASSMLAFSRAMQDQEHVKALPVWVVSAGIHDVSGEEMLQPSHASLLGACTIAAQESPKLLIRNLDVAMSAHNRQRLVEQLLVDTINGARERVVAYRGGHRWVPTLARAGANGSVPSGARTYLLINGLGSLGVDFSQQLAREANHRLVLVETTDFPARELWDEWVANDSAEGLITAKIKRLRELEKQTEVFLVHAELSDEAQAHALLKQVKERFNLLDGAVYIFDDDATTDEHALLTDKVQGLVALDKALQDEDLSCRLVVSRTRTDNSLSAADSAVRFFVDTFASDSTRNGRRHWTSVTWDFAPANGNGLDHAIERLLQLDTPQVIVSAEPLTEGWNKLEALINASGTKPERQPITTYARPNLRVTYVAPRTPTEQAIAQIWSELLGIEQIGAHDSFLELGGDSLLAVRLISRLRDVFNQNFPLRLIFEASTVAELAKSIEPQSEEDSELAEIMGMLEQLSEEDAERELLKRQQAMTREATA